MVKVTIRWTIKATNTGIPHDLICGCSLLDPSTGEALYDLPWWVIWDVPSGKRWSVPIGVILDVVPGTYTAKCRAWAGYTAGTKATDLKIADGTIVGIAYYGGTGLCNPPILDEAVQTLVIGQGAVSARIDDFAITI